MSITDLSITVAQKVNYSNCSCSGNTVISKIPDKTIYPENNLMNIGRLFRLLEILKEGSYDYNHSMFKHS